MVAASASWWSAASCRYCDPDLFFPLSAAGPSQQQIAEAKQVCARCVVRRECAEYALRTRQVHGVWGGMSEEERRLAGSRDQRRADR